jgi:DTW domain-containing protein YfiP
MDVPDSSSSVRGHADGGERCPRCALHVHACLCADIEPLRLATRIIVLRHRKEAHKTTNTGRLVPLMLPGSEIRAFGERHDVLTAASLVDPARNTLLLYPSEDSRLLTRADAADRPVTLIVPDANWRRAFKVNSREPALSGLPRVRLPEGARSSYLLRRHPDPRFLATFEAVARALGILEGTAVQEHLERVFALMVERTLRSRGRFAVHHALRTQDAGS